MPFIVTTKRPVAPDEHGQPFCGACSHYHEGACLRPDCGHPTPCRDHYASASMSTPAIETTARRAVATLEEAKEAVTCLVLGVNDPHGGLRSPAGRRLHPDARQVVWFRLKGAIGKLPESGGSVGPLPDGTVIEVEAVSWSVLARRSGSRHVTDMPCHVQANVILDAFNRS